MSHMGGGGGKQRAERDVLSSVRPLLQKTFKIQDFCGTLLASNLIDPEENHHERPPEGIMAGLA